MSAEMASRIRAAQASELSSQELQKLERRHKELQNEYQRFLQETRGKIDDRTCDVQSNLFALNELKLQELLREWNSWFQLHADSDNATLEGKLSTIRRLLEEEMARFAEEFRRHQAEEAAAEKKRKEEEKRQREEEEKRQREEQEKRDKAELKRYRDLLSRSVQLCSHLSNEDLRFLIDRRALFAFPPSTI